MYTFPSLSLPFLLTVARWKTARQQFTPDFKKSANTFTCKKGAIKITHPHKRSAPSMEKEHARVIQSGFFPPLVEVTVRIKYAIILFKRGLPVWEGGRVRRGEGWLFFKGKGWINGINKAGFVCLSSALSLSLADISVLLNVSLTANEIRRKYRESLAFSILSLHESAVTERLPRLLLDTIIVIKTAIAVVIIILLIAQPSLHHHLYNHVKHIRIHLHVSVA